MQVTSKDFSTLNEVSYHTLESQRVIDTSVGRFYRPIVKCDIKKMDSEYWVYGSAGYMCLSSPQTRGTYSFPRCRHSNVMSFTVKILIIP